MLAIVGAGPGLDAPLGCAARSMLDFNQIRKHTQIGTLQLPEASLVIRR
ncbi:hypothetical protein [Sorangium sp. So ce887]